MRDYSGYGVVALATTEWGSRYHNEMINIAHDYSGYGVITLARTKGHWPGERKWVPHCQRGIISMVCGCLCLVLDVNVLDIA